MAKVIKEADIKTLLERKEVNALIEVLKFGGTRAMQMDAAVALGKIRDKRAIEPLSEMVNNKYAWIDIRVYAVQSLGSIGGKKAIEALKRAAVYRDFHGNSEDVEAIKNAAKMALNVVSPGKKRWEIWK